MVIDYIRPPQARRDALLPTARPQVRKNRRRTLWGTWRIFSNRERSPGVDASRRGWGWEDEKKTFSAS